MEELDIKERLKWTVRLHEIRSPSGFLRELSAHFSADKYDLAELAAEVLPDRVTGEDMQIIWKWDLGNVGDGIRDSDLDVLLHHILDDECSSTA